jgi:hypothetical protein
MQGPEGLMPDCIPQSMVEKGFIFHFSMAQLRPDSIAWKKEAAIEVIETLADHAYAILGGDVLTISGEQLAYTGDYWDLPDEDVVLWEEYVEHTRERSIDFIEEISRGKGETFVYAIFFIGERDYRKQIRDFGNIKYR